MRIAPLSRRVVVLALLLAACSRDPAPVAAPAPVITDKQAIDAATANERLYQDALAKGDLAFLAGCNAGAPESIRLVDLSGDSASGYSLAITADARGAVAIWQGLSRTPAGTYQAFGPQGMRLDGNGWRQLRQKLMEAVASANPGVRSGIPQPRQALPNPFVAYCLEGRPSVAWAEAAFPDGSRGFESLAVSMRRLSGNRYSPPAR